MGRAYGRKSQEEDKKNTKKTKKNEKKQKKEKNKTKGKKERKRFMQIPRNDPLEEPKKLVFKLSGNSDSNRRQGVA